METEMETEIDSFLPQINYSIFLKCRSNWHLSAHSVEHSETSSVEITYVIEGKASYTIDGKPYKLEPGDLLYLPASSTEQAVTNPKDPMCCFSVGFDPMYPSLKSKIPSLPIVNRIGLRKDLIDRFRELTICWSEQQAGYLMKTRALLMLILHRLQEIISINGAVNGETEEEGQQIT